MTEKMSVCGYRCDLCTVHKDNLKRVGKETVKAGFKKYYNYEFPDEALIGCDGCPVDGDGDCSVKPCAKEKGVSNCGLCKKFSCEKVQEKMDVINKHFDDVNALTERGRQLFVEPYQSTERLQKINRDL